MTTTIRLRALACAAATVSCGAATLGLSACERDPSLRFTPARENPEATYTVRGRVEKLPALNEEGLTVHHEAVNDFVNPDGSVGMNSMVMWLPVARGVPLDGIAVGDVVELKLGVWSAGTPRQQILAVRELPAETPLNFGRATPPP